VTPAADWEPGHCRGGTKATTRQPYRASVRPVRTRWLLPVCAAVVLAGCTRVVTGAAALPATQTPGPLLPAGVDVERIVLDTARMQAITGAGAHLTVIPTMDVRSPVDIEALAATVPADCRFRYAETAVFGREFTQFHKTTFQYPPKAALISEAVAAYPDADSARRAFGALMGNVAACSETSAGMTLVGDWDADEQSLRTRAGRCGSDYLVKSAMLLEVTFCGFGESAAELVLTNLAAGAPG
jgi:CRISPR-associated Cas5-like protein